MTEMVYEKIENLRTGEVYVEGGVGELAPDQSRSPTTTVPRVGWFSRIKYSIGHYEGAEIIIDDSKIATLYNKWLLLPIGLSIIASVAGGTYLLKKRKP